jgi:hypothetical protein
MSTSVTGACANPSARAGVEGRCPQTAKESTKCQKKKHLCNNLKTKNVDTKVCSSNKKNEDNGYGQLDMDVGSYDTLTLKVKAQRSDWL